MTIDLDSRRHHDGAKQIDREDVRIGLGANRRQVLGLVIGQSLVMTAAGMLLGLGGGAAPTRYLDQLLFGVSPRASARLRLRPS